MTALLWVASDSDGEKWQGREHAERLEDDPGVKRVMSGDKIAIAVDRWHAESVLMKLGATPRLDFHKHGSGASVIVTPETDPKVRTALEANPKVDLLGTWTKNTGDEFVFGAKHPATIFAVVRAILRAEQLEEALSS